MPPPETVPVPDPSTDTRSVLCGDTGREHAPAAGVTGMYPMAPGPPDSVSVNQVLPSGPTAASVTSVCCHAASPVSKSAVAPEGVIRLRPSRGRLVPPTMPEYQALPSAPQVRTRGVAHARGNSWNVWNAPLSVTLARTPMVGLPSGPRPATGAAGCRHAPIHSLPSGPLMMFVTPRRLVGGANVVT